MGLDVQRFQWNYLDSNMYIIKQGKEAIIIDPVDNKEAFGYLEGVARICVLLTHEHFDHICGLNRLREEFDCIVIAHKLCSERIQNQKKNFSVYADVMIAMAEKPFFKKLSPFVCERADCEFEELYELSWLDHRVKLVSTAGHSPGSICILLDSFLFTGDTLLAKEPMIRFPGSSRNQFEKCIPTLQELLQIAEMVFPGHGEPASAKDFEKYLPRVDS